MIVLNTCHIRDRAAEKVFSELGRLRLVKQARALHLSFQREVADMPGHQPLRQPP